LLLEMANAAADTQARGFVLRRIEAYTDALERILAAPKGSMERPDFTALQKAWEGS
jgi:hypothetical protein